MQNDGGGNIDYGGAYGNANNFSDASPLKTFFHSKWVKLIIVMDIIAIIAVIVFIIFNNTKTAIVNFSIAPVDAKIQLNGSGDYTNGSYQVHPGTYEVSVSHDGLETKYFTLDLQSGYNTTLTTFLKGANDDFDFYTLRDNYESFQKLASIASKDNNLTTDADPSAEQFIQDFQQQYALYQTTLPIVYNDTKVTTLEDGSLWYSTANTFDIMTDNSDQCQKTICLKVIMSTGSSQNLVDEFLREKGFNLNLCEVKYANYNS